MDERGPRRELSFNTSQQDAPGCKGEREGGSEREREGEPSDCEGLSLSGVFGSTQGNEQSKPLGVVFGGFADYYDRENEPSPRFPDHSTVGSVERRRRVDKTRHTHSPRVHPQDSAKTYSGRRFFQCGSGTESLCSRAKRPQTEITSFRHFYYFPVVDWGPGGVRHLPADGEMSRDPFLRKSRYMEKMVKDYDLGDALFPSAETSCFHDNDWQCQMHSGSTRTQNRLGNPYPSGVFRPKRSRTEGLSMDVLDEDSVCISPQIRTRPDHVSCEHSRVVRSLIDGQDSSINMRSVLQNAVKRVRNSAVFPSCARCFCPAKSSCNCCCCPNEAPASEEYSHRQERQTIGDRDSAETRNPRIAFPGPSVGPDIDQIKNFLSTCRTVVNNENTHTDFEASGQMLRLSARENLRGISRALGTPQPEMRHEDERNGAGCALDPHLRNGSEEIHRTRHLVNTSEDVSRLCHLDRNVSAMSQSTMQLKSLGGNLRWDWPRSHVTDESGEIGLMEHLPGEKVPTTTSGSDVDPPDLADKETVYGIEQWDDVRGTLKVRQRLSRVSLFVLVQSLCKS